MDSSSNGKLERMYKATTGFQILDNKAAQDSIPEKSETHEAIPAIPWTHCQEAVSNPQHGEGGTQEHGSRTDLKRQRSVSREAKTASTGRAAHLGGGGAQRGPRVLGWVPICVRGDYVKPGREAPENRLSKTSHRAGNSSCFQRQTWK